MPNTYATELSLERRTVILKLHGQVDRVAAARVGELRRHRGRLHRLPRADGRRGVGAGRARGEAAAEPLPLPRLHDGRLEPARHPPPALGRPTRSATARGRCSRSRSRSSGSSGGARDVDVLELPLDEYVAALGRYVGCASRRARERRAAARRARTRASRRSRTPSSTRCSSSAASASSEIVVANLLASRLTVLYGPSGVGKSSLLRARSRGGCARSPTPRSSSSRRGRAIRRGSRGDRSAVGRRAAVPRLAAAAELAATSTSILDQFEEFFLYHADEEGEGTFADELAASCSAAPTSASNVLIAVREDALAQLDAFKARIPNLLANYLRLDHLDRAAGARRDRRAARALQRARRRGRARRDRAGARRRGARRGAAGRVELGGVGAAAIRPATAAPGRSRRRILQLVLERLWRAERDAGSRTLRLATLRGLGGAAQIVRDHLERRARRAAAGASRTLRRRCSTTSSRRRARRSRSAPATSRDVRGRRRRRARAGARDARPGAHPARGRDGGGAAPSATRSSTTCSPTPCSPGGPSGGVQRERQDAQRRHRRLLVLAVCSLAALAVVTAIAVFALTERDRARSHERQATARELEASALLGLQRGESDSLALALHAAQLEPGRAAETVLRQVLVESRLRAVLTTPPVASLQYSARRAEPARRGRRPARARVRPADGSPGAGFRDAGVVTHAVFGPGGLLLSGDENGVATLRRLDATRPLQRVRGRGPVTALAFSRDGRLFLVATGGRHGPRDARRRRARQRAAATRPGRPGRLRPCRQPASRQSPWSGEGAGARASTTPARAGSSTCCRSSPSRTWSSAPTASCSPPAATTGRSACGTRATGRPLGRLDDKALNVKDIARSAPTARCSRPATATASRASGPSPRSRASTSCTATPARVDSVAWSPDGRVLAAASSDQSATLHGIDTRVDKGGVLATLPGNAGGTTALAYNPSGTRLATGGLDGGVRVWDALPEQTHAAARAPSPRGSDGGVLAGRTPRRLGKRRPHRAHLGRARAEAARTCCPRPAR